MPQNRTLTSQEIDDGWSLEEEPLGDPDDGYESYELSWEPEAFGTSAQFSEAYSAMLEERLQRDATPVSPRWGLRPFGIN